VSITAHPKRGLFTWVALAITYQWWTGALSSLVTLLMIFPGFLLGSFAAVPVAILDWQKDRHLLRLREIHRSSGRQSWWPLFA